MVIVPRPSRRQDQVIGLHGERAPVHHGENLLSALDGETQRIDGVAVRPGDFSGFDHLHARHQVLRRAPLQLGIGEHQRAPRGIAVGHRLAGALQDFLHVLPFPHMRHARRHRLDEDLAVGAFAHVLRAVGIDLPLAAQIGGGHARFQIAHTRIGFSRCHGRSPCCRADLCSPLPRQRKENSMAAILTCQRPPSVLGSHNLA